MSSRSQIEANRRNARKSTGPRTARGKAVSSMNALKSPIDTLSSVIPGEDSAALVALTRQFYQDCQPQTVIEKSLVNNIVRDAWLLRRFARIDAEMLDAGLADNGLLIPIIDGASSAHATTIAGQAFRNCSESQSRLQGRINATRRNQIQAIKELQRLQAERAQSPRPATQPIDNKSNTSKNGFVPLNRLSGIQ